MPMMMRRLTLALLACLTLTSCKDDSPPPPSTGEPGGEVEISGGERLGWNQQAANTFELASFQYAIYIDGVRSELSGAGCGTTAGEAGFECSAPLPGVPAGSHTIELASFVVAGFESARSSPLRVRMAGVVRAGSMPAASAVFTAEQVRLNLTLIASGLAVPSDLAFGRDGAIYIAERGGTVRVVRDDVLLSEPALDLTDDVSLPEGGLLAIALDPKFAESRIAYLLYASRAPGRALAFTLARFREARDSFGERAVLLDRIPASPRGAAGALRLGPDGKLYVGLDDAANGRAAMSLASYNGKILRLNTDATTPDDQAGFNPVFSVDHPLPKALDWQPSSGRLWVVDRLEPASGRLTAVMSADAKVKRGAAGARYTLPAGTGASSAAFYRGQRMPMFRDNLFIAAESGRHLIRARFDPLNAERIVSIELLLQDQIGPVMVVGVGPDEALYICSDRALYRLAP
jgi:glucose/arabinose dehydrogenase